MPESDEVSEGGEGGWCRYDAGAWCASQPCAGSSLRSEAMRGSEAAS